MIRIGDRSSTGSPATAHAIDRLKIHNITSKALVDVDWSKEKPKKAKCQKGGKRAIELDKKVIADIDIKGRHGVLKRSKRYKCKKASIAGTIDMTRGALFGSNLQS